jgi:hypothetical protein
LIIGLALLPALLACSFAKAQDLDKLQQAGEQPQATDEITQTEQMWFYLQELRRYDDPQVMIRRKAEKKARQRRQRLAAMKWYGYSPSRPMANPVPIMGYHSPMWSGNGGDPYLWVGNAYVQTTVRVETAEVSETTSR